MRQDAILTLRAYCLAAHDKGLGSVALGIFDKHAIHPLVSLAENERVTNLIALGYTLENEKSAPLRKEVFELLTVID